MSTESKKKEMEKIDLFKNDIRFRRKIEHVETIPGKKASYKKVDKLNKKIMNDKIVEIFDKVIKENN